MNRIKQLARKLSIVEEVSSAVLLCEIQLSPKEGFTKGRAEISPQAGHLAPIYITNGDDIVGKQDELYSSFSHEGARLSSHLSGANAAVS
jgi:hypothetical protein